MDRICDEVWVVWVDEETRFSVDEAGWIITGRCSKRIDAQMSLDEKAAG